MSNTLKVPDGTAAPRSGSATHTETRPALIAAERITVRSGVHELLRDVSVSVRAGEVVTIVGPNGGGKSTLIRALLGLIPLAAGRVRRQPGLCVGYVPQRLAVDSTLPLPVHRLMTLTSRANRSAIETALAECGAAHLIAAPVHTLSGGELQRVLLARAVLRSPQLLVLDEPTQGVDRRGQSALYQLIETIRTERGCGVLMVSHDVHVILGASRRVYCLDVTIRCQGGPEAVRTDPAYAELLGDNLGTLGVYAHDPVLHALRDDPV